MALYVKTANKSKTKGKGIYDKGNYVEENKGERWQRIT
jgi:hypothetical protein